MDGHSLATPWSLGSAAPLAYDIDMRSLAVSIAVVLVLAFGLGVTARSNEPVGMAAHQMAAVADHTSPSSDDCLMCSDEHATMSASACFIWCIGALVDGTLGIAFVPPTQQMVVASVAVLQGRSRSPDPHPPKLSRI
jgi:hypothetical protein